MAAALSASPWGPSRAGREPGKIQPLSPARVTHSTRGGPRAAALGSLFPQARGGGSGAAGRTWPPRRVGVSGGSQTPRENARTPPFPSRAVALRGTSHSLHCGVCRTHTGALSPPLFLSQARRGLQLASSTEPRRAAQGQAQGPPPGRPRAEGATSTRRLTQIRAQPPHRLG